MSPKQKALEIADRLLADHDQTLDAIDREFYPCLPYKGFDGDEQRKLLAEYREARKKCIT